MRANQCQYLSIGTLAEKSLHSELKSWCARPGDLFEEKVDAYVADIVRGEQIIEIQTGNFSGFKVKLATLLKRHPVHVILPVAVERTYVRESASGRVVSSRRSPRKGRVIDAFNELVGIAHLLMDPNLTLEVVLVREKFTLRDDGRGSWRRMGWSAGDRVLVSVESSVMLSSIGKFLALLPPLPVKFTARDVAQGLGCTAGLSRKIAYCLRHTGAIHLAGKAGRAYLYELGSEMELGWSE